jgi:N-acetylmuramoyl-L-alanine amidase
VSDNSGSVNVLVGAHMPCVLVETAFLTHPGEGQRLAGKAYREAVAEVRACARFVTDSRRAQTL